jgi:hypothetical protein
LSQDFAALSFIFSKSQDFPSACIFFSAPSKPVRERETLMPIFSPFVTFPLNDILSSFPEMVLPDFFPSYLEISRGLENSILAKIC